MQIWFEIAQAPVPGATLSSTLKLVEEPPYRTYLLDPLGDEIPFTPEHGNYQYVSPPREEPILEVQPEFTVASAKGQLFNINVTIKDLDVKWKLIAIQFKLRFNITMLQIVEVVEGPFLKQFPQPGRTTENATIFVWFDDSVYGYDYVIVDVVLWPAYDAEGNAYWSDFPEGSGTVATITFKAIWGPPAYSAIELYDVLLLDEIDYEIPYRLKHGNYAFPTEVLTHPVVWTDPITGQTHEFTVQTVSNSSISEMEFNQRHRFLTFTATGSENTVSFCNITIPRELLYSEPDKWLILVNGRPAPYSATLNTTHMSIYFTYTLSTSYIHIFGIEVIPELPIAILPLLSLIATTTAVGLRKVKTSRKNKNPLTALQT